MTALTRGSQDMNTKRNLVNTLLIGIALIVGAPTAWAHKNLTNAQVGVSPNPVTEGTSATITGTLTYTGAQGSGSSTGHTLFPTNGDPVSGVTLNIEELQLADAGVACGTSSAIWVQIATGTTDALGKVSTNFDTTGLGGSTICFRTQNPAAGGAHGIDANQSPGVDLVILSQPACVPGATIAATLASGDGTPAPGNPAGPWTFRITVTACGDLTNVTAQGGANAWAPYTGALPDTGEVDIRKQTKKNTILLWTIGNMSDGQVANLDVGVNGPIPYDAPDCQVRYLSGPWSATFSADGGATFEKSAYSGRVSVSVDTDGDGNPACP